MQKGSRVRHIYTKQRQKGFTIVELLIVIVVIAILAAITIVAYNGITKQAHEGVLRADLSSTAKKLALYKVDNGNYPASLGSGERVQSSGTTLTYTASGQKFCLQASNVSIATLKFSMTEDGVVREGDCMVTATAIASGANYTCLQGSNGKAYCWGYGAGGRLGTGDTANTSIPKVVAQGAIPNGVTIASVSAGTAQGCVVGSDGKGYCWGYNADGRLGIGATGDKSSPTAMSQGAIPGGVTIASLWPANASGCAIGSDAKVYCWGRNNYGQLGNGLAADSNSPVAVSQGAIPNGVSIVMATDSGDGHTCALVSNGKVYCWGLNNYGQLGNGTTTNSNLPVAVSQGAIPNGVSIKSVVAGTNQTCAIGSDNWAYCWGNNLMGQLGNNASGDSSTPVAVVRGSIPTGAAITSISTRAYRTCAITSDGQVYCWGYGWYGQLGNGDTANSTVPVTVSRGDMPVGVTATAIKSGDSHACLLGSDGQTYCWGYNGYGQLGDSTTTNRSVPTAVVMPLL